MSRANRIISAVAVCGLLAVSALARTGTAPAAKSPVPKSTQSHAAKAKAPAKTDAEIQSCIEQKLAAAAKLKDQHFSVAVANGAATFTGMATNASSKGGVDSIARSCGAKKVVNSINVAKTTKPAAATTGAAKSPPKPK